MNHSEPELQTILETFDYLLKTYPDETNSIYAYNNFLNLLLRIQTHALTPPISEMMTILKHEKPYVYQTIKEQGSYSFYLFNQTSFTSTPKEAKQKLTRIKLKINQSDQARRST
ncbi:hypothetical protein [Halalkalibacterium ligniniphilum]|uniref:hypothetical protein n=1 Tax=Halalkalibacterium ligniniphilum TaxID=1134413 RepID=UPI000349AACE|nr:hypothetical protein [Halalkalibacterium ligniniphilum]